MTIEGPATIAIAGAAGAMAGYAIKMAELWVTTRTRDKDRKTAERQNVLDAFASLTDRLQTRLTYVETRLDQANTRLEVATQRIAELEAQTTKLNTQLAQAKAQLNKLLKEATPLCPAS
jgi:chromosome segregation ATPase